MQGSEDLDFIGRVLAPLSLVAVLALQMPLPADRAKVVEKALSNGAEFEDPAIVKDLQEVEEEVAAALGAEHMMASNRAMLRRFVVARKGSVPDILAMIEAHMAWRTQHLPPVVTEAVVAELKKGKIEVYGHDVQGRPLVIVHSGKFDPKERDLATCLTSIVHLIESACSQLKTDQPPKITIFYDRQGFSLRKNWDLEYLKCMIAALSDNYPEFLGGVYIYPAGGLLLSLWAIVRPFIEVRTRGKVKLINSEKDLLSLVPSEFVPVASGGTSQHVFDPSIYDGLLAPPPPAEIS